MARVLVCGAGGFIGRHVVAQLRAAGHIVVEGRSQQLEFARCTEPKAWLRHLQGIDAVINAVGVLRDSRQRPMEAVHTQAPVALFEACAQAGIRRVIHVSALGIVGSDTLYARSKLAADDALLALREQGRLDATVLRPSIVFGRGGASSQLFMSLARLPVLVLPAAALRARVQPVAVQDLALAISRLLEESGPAQLCAVGPRPLSLADFIATLRAQSTRPAAQVLALPDGPSRWSARLGDRVPGQPWCSETLDLLQRDNIGDVDPLARLLGRPPIAPERLVKQAWSAA